jgi:hypothetical protein
VSIVTLQSWRAMGAHAIFSVQCPCDLDATLANVPQMTASANKCRALGLPHPLIPAPSCRTTPQKKSWHQRRHRLHCSALPPHIAGHGLDIPSLPAAAHCSSAPLAAAVREQAVSQCPDTLHSLRFPILWAPAISLAIGAVDVDAAAAEQRDYHSFAGGGCSAGRSCRERSQIQQLPQDILEKRSILAAG